MTTHLLRLPALEIRQGTRRIYSFAVDGKLLDRFAAVSRLRRDTDEPVQGYQRPESLAHIRGIRRYLESPGAMLPNAIVVAFDDRVTFTPALSTAVVVDYAVPGELVIPVDDDLPEHQRPAWLVDGQQRAAALRDARVTAFPVAVVGFITDSEQEQRSQFILVNSTKALPKGLIYELLPDTTALLPAGYARKAPAATLMVRLNTTPGSPFRGRIKSPTAPGGTITDTSVLKTVEHGLTDGALFQYRDLDGGIDLDRATRHLTTCWSAVADTWPDAWAKPPRTSRLTHGAGICAVGYLLDELTETTPAEDLDPDRLRDRLTGLATAWTAGTWQFPDGEIRRWDGVQNTAQDIRALTTCLRAQLRPARPARPARGAA